MSENGDGAAMALAVRAEERQAISPFAGAQQFDVEQRRALALSRSTVVPKAYQNNLPNVLVAMEYANRLGCSVLAVMQNLDVVQGTPALRAKFKIGTVNASGRFTPIRFRWEGTKGQDDYGCRAWAKDKESGEECVGPLINWTLVKAEGWLGKPGSKWKTMDEKMFMYRAAAWWSDVFCPEMSLGLITTEELLELGHSVGTDRAAALSAALDAGDDSPPPTLEGEVIKDGDDPGDDEANANMASSLALDQLNAKRDTAREKDLLDMDDEEAIAAALSSQDAGQVRIWIATLDDRIAAAPKKAKAAR